MAWQIDTTHSDISFTVKHMMVSTVRGHFKAAGGFIEVNAEDPTKSVIEAEIDPATVDTRDANRDNHLKSPDFFDVAQHPKWTFKSTKIESLGGNDYNITGDLTIHGVTRPATFKAEYSGIIKDPYGLSRAGVNAEGKINRKDFGLTWNSLLETGGAVVGDEIKIFLDIEVVSQN